MLFAENGWHPKLFRRLDSEKFRIKLRSVLIQQAVADLRHFAIEKYLHRPKDFLEDGVMGWVLHARLLNGFQRGSQRFVSALIDSQLTETMRNFADGHPAQM